MQKKKKKILTSNQMDFKLVNGKMSYIYCCLWFCPSEECQEWFRSTVVFFFCWLSSLSVWLYWVNQTDRLPPSGARRGQDKICSSPLWSNSLHWRENWGKNNYSRLNSVKCQGMYLEILHKKSIHCVAEKASTNFSALPDWFEPFSNCIFSLVMIKE